MEDSSETQQNLFSTSSQGEMVVATQNTDQQLGPLEEFRPQVPLQNKVLGFLAKLQPLAEKVPGAKFLSERLGASMKAQEELDRPLKYHSARLATGKESPSEEEIARQPVASFDVGILSAVPKALPQGVAKVTKRGIPVMQEFVDYAKKLDDLGPVEYKPTSLLDPVRAANKLDKAEDGLIRRTFLDPIIKADDNLIREAEALKARVSSLAGGVKSGSETDQLIRRYGERRVYPENFTPDDAAKVTPQVQKAADGFREIYDNLLERANAARSKAGQKLIPRRADYFTHSEELGVLTTLFGDLEKIPGEMLRVASFTKPNAPFFKFSLPRMFHRTSAGAIEGFERYMQSALPVIHYTDPIMNTRAHLEFLPPRASSYFNDLANDLAGKKSLLDRPFPDPVLKFFDAFRRLTSKGTILGNVSTAFLQPSSIASTISRAGFVNTIKAIPETFSDIGVEFAQKYSKVLRARTYDPDINPKTLSKVENVLGWMIKTLDGIIVRNSFIANFKYATNVLKKPLEEAVRYADDLASKTQATNRKVFQPPLLRSRVGSTLGQLQTFTTNLYNQVRRDIPIIAKEKGKMEAIKSALYLGVSAVAINQLYEEAGLPAPYNLTTFVPFTSSARYGEPTPALSGALGAAQTIFGEGETRAAGLDRLGRFATSLVPGGRQAVKTLKGLSAISEGGSKTESGNLRFRIKGGLEETRALLFGPNQTEAGRKFYEGKGKKKPLKL